MKAMKQREDDIPSIPLGNFKDHYLLVLYLTSMQDATENCRYPDLVVEPLRLELKFTFPIEHVTELIVLGERKSSVAVDTFGVVGKVSKMDIASLQKTIKCIPLLKYRYLGSFPSDYVSIPPKGTCHYKYATPQYAGEALDNDGKLSSHIVFCRPSVDPVYSSSSKNR